MSNGCAQSSHDDMAALEQRMVAKPDSGDLGPGTGGLGKVRARQRAVGRGTRAGVRVYDSILPHDRSPI